jgi:oxygen-independent coproporphyrinogen III oxidase
MSAAIIPPFFSPAKPDGILQPMESHSVYVHIPFCQKRCSYCDFNTYAGFDDLIPAYVSALKKEIEILTASRGETIPVGTIFFGGGTPSLLSDTFLRQILTLLAESFDFQNDIEITLEANPGTLRLEYLAALRNMGVNRLSMGMQSAQPRDLKLLDRQHTHQDVIKAVTWARQAGFSNLSLDLIFGVPTQSLENWADTLDQALELGPEHFSLYALTVEPKTPLHSWVTAGTVASPDSDLAADMYDLACEKLAVAGYVQYEISNWARGSGKWQIPHAEMGMKRIDPSALHTPNSPFKCRHNLQYWHNLPYLGFGAGAHGFVGGYRIENLRGLADYIQALENYEQKMDHFPRTPATQNLIPIDPETEMRETMIMGLRLTEAGVSAEMFKARFGTALLDVFGGEIEKLINWGLLEWRADSLRLTPRGRLLGNQVFVAFV